MGTVPNSVTSLPWCTKVPVRRAHADTARAQHADGADLVPVGIRLAGDAHVLGVEEPGGAGQTRRGSLTVLGNTGGRGRGPEEDGRMDGVSGDS
jgi:hypothetical protein